METTLIVAGYVFALLATAAFLYGVIRFLRGPQQVKAPLPKKTQRVLMFGWEFPPHNSGGLGVATMGIARALTKGRADLTLVLPKKLADTPAGMRVIMDETSGIRGIAVDSPLSPYLTSGSYARAADGSPVYGPSLMDEVARYGRFGGTIGTSTPHDVVYAHDWLSFPAGMAASRASGAPLVVHMHATEYDRTASDDVNQHVYDTERAGMHAASRVIAVSERTKRTIVARYGVAPDKVAVVYNGIDDATAPLRADGARLSALKSAGYAVVLFMGRLTRQKGPDYFIRAASQVLQHRPKTIFVVAGSGDMERKLIEQAASAGIGDRVLFPGFLRGTEQAEAIAAADLFVMPSVSEPFGLSALEAIRAGTPVILSKQSGIAEVVPHAPMVDFWDTDKLATLIEDLLTHPTQRASLSRSEATDAAPYTWERAADDIRAVLDAASSRLAT